MRLLFVSPYVPHPRCGHGGGVFIYGMLEQLSASHDISLLSYCDASEEAFAADLKKLPIECHFIHRAKGKQGSLAADLLLMLKRSLDLVQSVFRWEPYYVAKFRGSAMGRWVEKLTTEKRYDVVQIEYTQMAPFRAFVHSGKAVLHELDVSYRPAYRKYRRARSLVHKGIAYVEWCRWARYESSLGQRFDQILAVTEQDMMLLRWLTRSGTVEYFPHAVEIPGTLPAYSNRDPRTLVFVGTYSHTPNIDAARWLCTDIFPRVKAACPGATLYIVGPHPPQDIRDISKRQEGIVVTGFVDDVNLYLRKCAVFVAPLRQGGGVKNKILFAMAQGIPVVTTRVGLEGIEGMHADSVLAAETPEKISEHICLLFAEPDRAAAMGTMGWKAMQQWYSWERVTRWVEGNYRNLVGEQEIPRPGRLIQ